MRKLCRTPAPCESEKVRVGILLLILFLLFSVSYRKVQIHVFNNKNRYQIIKGGNKRSFLQAILSQYRLFSTASPC